MLPGVFAACDRVRQRDVPRSGTDANRQNSPQFKALREQALKLGSETQFTASDAASGQSFLAMAGFTPQAIQAALPGVLNMALAGGVELGETADIGSNILTQFNLTADQMDRVGDTLTAAFTRTNTDLRALGETMKYTGPVAAKLGISLEEAAVWQGCLPIMVFAEAMLVLPCAQVCPALHHRQKLRLMH